MECSNGVVRWRLSRVARQCAWLGLIGAAACTGEAGFPVESTSSVRQGIAGEHTVFYLFGDDTYLVENSSTNNGTADKLWVRSDAAVGGAPGAVALIKWNLAAGAAAGASPCAPSTWIVSAATVAIRVSSTSNSPFKVYAANRDWVDTQANWTQATTQTSWQVPGAKGTQDRGSALQTFTPSSAGGLAIPLTGAGLAMVQSWYTTPSTNKGIILHHQSSADGFSIGSFNHASAGYRPVLSVQYSCP